MCKLCRVMKKFILFYLLFLSSFLGFGVTVEGPCGSVTSCKLVLVDSSWVNEKLKAMVDGDASVTFLTENAYGIALINAAVYDYVAPYVDFDLFVRALEIHDKGELFCVNEQGDVGGILFNRMQVRGGNIDSDTLFHSLAIARRWDTLNLIFCVLERKGMSIQEWKILADYNGEATDTIFGQMLLFNHGEERFGLGDHLVTFLFNKIEEAREIERAEEKARVRAEQKAAKARKRARFLADGEVEIKPERCGCVVQ
jgi:hypothetical protein